MICSKHSRQASKRHLISRFAKVSSYARFKCVNPEHNSMSNIQTKFHLVHPHTRSVASCAVEQCVVRRKSVHFEHSALSSYEVGLLREKRCFTHPVTQSIASRLTTRSSVARFNRVSGFTLIEVMVVIVIMTIMASLVVLNIGGVDQRRAMQAREMFILDLKKINKEATDQAKVFALNTQNATDVTPFSYNLFEYHDQSKEQIQQADRTWQPYLEFKTRQLPEQVSFSIESLDNENYPKAKNEDLLGGKAPQLIWFGNGEVKPARIQFYYQQQAIGHEFEVDHLGKVNEN